MDIKVLRGMIEAKIKELDTQLLQADTNIKNLDGMITGLNMVLGTINQGLADGEDIPMESGEAQEEVTDDTSTSACASGDCSGCKCGDD